MKAGHIASPAHSTSFEGHLQMLLVALIWKEVKIVLLEYLVYVLFSLITGERLGS